MIDINKISEEIAVDEELDIYEEDKIEDDCEEEFKDYDKKFPVDECDRFVYLCKTVVVPDFHVDSRNSVKEDKLNYYHDRTKLIYNKSCLHAIVVAEKIRICKGCKNSDNDKITIYKIKIVGSIPFAFSAENAIEKGKFDCGKDVDICAHGTVCVDNVICCKAHRKDADLIASSINRRLKKECDEDGIKIVKGPKYEIVKCEGKKDAKCKLDICENETLVKFTAVLRLPKCPEFRFESDDDCKTDSKF